jgi:hypothetical protein
MMDYLSEIMSTLTTTKHNINYNNIQECDKNTKNDICILKNLHLKLSKCKDVDEIKNIVKDYDSDIIYNMTTLRPLLIFSLVNLIKVLILDSHKRIKKDCT